MNPNKNQNSAPTNNEQARFIEGILTDEELKQVTGGRRGFRVRKKEPDCKIHFYDDGKPGLICDDENV